MCLIVNREKTAKHSKLRKNSTMKFWKTLEVVDNKLITPFQRCEVNPGIIVASDELDVFGFGDGVYIEGGCIHAFVSRRSIFERWHLYYKHIYIPVYVDSDDVIAFGKHDDVCFFKYTIKKEDYDRAVAFCIKNWGMIGSGKLKFLFPEE